MSQFPTCLKRGDREPDLMNELGNTCQGWCARIVAMARVHDADVGDQKGSPPGRYSIGTSGMNVFSHCAHSFIPTSSEGTWPRMIRAFLRPAVTASRAYSTPSHSRVSPIVRT